MGADNEGSPLLTRWHVKGQHPKRSPSAGSSPTDPRVARRGVTADLEAAWAEVDAANTSLGWTVGPRYLHDEVSALFRREQWAHDSRETPKVGIRSRERTAVGRTDVDCVREMARC